MYASDLSIEFSKLRTQLQLCNHSNHYRKVVYTILYGELKISLNNYAVDIQHKIQEDESNTGIIKAMGKS